MWDDWQTYQPPDKPAAPKKRKQRYGGGAGRVMHEGGIVPGAIGSEQWILAQAGEGVTSLADMNKQGGKSGFGGSTIVPIFNITINGVSGREMAFELERAVRDGYRSAVLFPHAS